MKYFGMAWGTVFVVGGIFMAWGLASDPNFRFDFEFFESKIQNAKASSSGKSGVPGELMPDQDPMAAPSEFDPNASAPVDDPEFAENPVPRIDKSPVELRKEIDVLCKDMQKKFEIQKMGPKFAKVNFKFHEEQHKEMVFSEMVKGCFKKDSDSKVNLEVDVFSSNFAGRASDQIQIQVSAFDFKSKNKIFETGMHFELSVPASAAEIEIQRKASE